ncbi:MAG: FIST N-terminal domain-containing protein [Terracidiphilus sp.]
MTELIKTEQFQWSLHEGWRPGLMTGTLAESVQLVFVFGQPELLKQSGCLGAIRETYPRAHFAGCSTAGEIHKVTVRDDTVAVTAVSFEHTHVTCNSVMVEGPAHSFKAGEELARSLDLNGLRHVIVFSEGIHANASDLVSGINSVLPVGVTVSGGFAGDGNRLQSTQVWCDCEPQTRMATAIGLYGQRLQVGVSAIGGWKPFGPDRLITKSRHNVLFEVDNNPVLPLYKQYLDKFADGLPATGLMFPLEIVIERNRVLRALIGIDEVEQSITYAGNIPEGAYARFMVGHRDDLIEGTLEAARSSIAPLTNTSAQLSLLVSCNGRRFVLKQRVEEEVEAVHEALGPLTAMTGFYSYGEIAPPSLDRHTELHNETMTVTSFGEV